MVSFCSQFINIKFESDHIVENMSTRRYDFDRVIDRKGTDSVKYDLLTTLYGREDLLPMWVADMDFEVPPFIREAIQERAAHPVYGYTFRPGRFYEAVTGWLQRRHRWNIPVETINFSPGVVPALNLCVLAYTEPGDRVIVQPPVYFPFFTAIKNHGRVMVENELICEDGRYTMDMAGLEEEFKKGVKMMLFCHPHNPVGRAWSSEKLEALAQLCVKYDVLLLSDEIHSDLLLFGNRHIPVASLGDAIAAQTITCMAPSKTFNLAGLHSSAVIITNPELKKVYDQALDAYHIGGGNLFGMVAMEAAYNEGDEWLDQLIEYLEGNFTFFKEAMEEFVPDIRVFPLEATYLAWLDFRAMDMEDKSLRNFITSKAHLGLVDGSRFGSGGSGFQRINIAAPRSVLEQATEQLTGAVKGYLRQKV